MAQAKLSEREKVSVLMTHGWRDRFQSYDQVRLLFNRTFRNGEGLNPVSKSTIKRTVRRFMNHGSIKDLQRTGRPKSAGSEMQMDIAQEFVKSPHLSLRQASDERDVAPETVRNILNRINFHPYKVHLVQELNGDDPDCRVEFCEIMMDRIDRYPLFLYNTVFSDEATFTLKSEVNRQNCRYWSDTNPDWMLESHTQYPQKINVCAGILNETLKGPFFIDGNLNACAYEELLRN